MINILDITKSKCSGCYACAAKCPQKCISMKVDDEGFWYPTIDSSKCINCGICEKTCPIFNNQTCENTSERAFAVINKNDRIRLNSSSGGVFTLLAEKILDCGGVVFGAAFTPDFKSVDHIDIHNKSQLYLLMGSKYLQSRIGDAYLQVEKYLKENKKVLFSGTPCQISGLYAYLGKDYDNLITQDIICHGVPSPLVWKKYVDLRENKANSTVDSIFFREKKNGWKNFSLKFIFKTGKKYTQVISKDLYMRGFLTNLYLRPSCYDCSFKSENRIADITLADFWGIENINSKMNDDKGTSLILVNTTKAIELFEKIKNDIVFCDVDKSKALKYNIAATKSANMHKKRNAFMQDFQILKFEKLIKKYCGEKFFVKIKFYFKRILKKFLKLVVGGRNGI